MKQDELWLTKWQEAIDILETNRRKPSKFVPEERNMWSWWKHNKKLMNAGELKPERMEMFELVAGAWGKKQACKSVSVSDYCGVNVPSMAI